MSEDKHYDPEGIESKYRFDKMPEFKSKIPAYLTKNLEAKELYIVETVSIMEQQVEFNTKQLAVATEAIVDLDKFKIWALKIYSRFMSKWTIIWVIVVWLASIFAKPLFEIIHITMGGAH